MPFLAVFSLVAFFTVASFSFLFFLLFFFSTTSSFSLFWIAFSFFVSFSSALGWDQLVSLAMDLIDFIARRAIEPEPETSRSMGGARRPEAGVLPLPLAGEAGRGSGSIRIGGANKVCEGFVPNE